MIGNFIKGLLAGILGFLLWAVASIIAAFTTEGDSFSFFKLLMVAGFLLMILGPIAFWILIPTKDKWINKKYIKYPIFGILGIFTLIVLSTLLPPSLPADSFTTKISGNTVTLFVKETKGVGSFEEFKITLNNPNGEEVDSRNVFGDEWSRPKTYNLSIRNRGNIGVPPIEGNYTVIIKNEQNKIIYQNNVTYNLPKYKLGETILIKGVSITFEPYRITHEVECKYSYKTNCSAKQNYKFVVVPVKAKNINSVTKQSVDVYGARMKIKVDKGYIYDAYSGGTSFTLNPEESDSGNIVFEILESTNPIEIYYTPDIFSETTYVIDLKGK